jgi:hypothetical protein
MICNQPFYLSRSVTAKDASHECLMLCAFMTRSCVRCHAKGHALPCRGRDWCPAVAVAVPVMARCVVDSCLMSKQWVGIRVLPQGVSVGVGGCWLQKPYERVRMTAVL